MRHLELHEVMPDRQYRICHQLGDGYSGPSGGYIFERGVIPEPVPGYMVGRNGMAHVCVIFDWEPAYVASWRDGAWYCSIPETEPPARPEKPEPEEKPKRKRGRPKGSKSKARV